MPAGAAPWDEMAPGEDNSKNLRLFDTEALAVSYRQLPIYQR